MSGSAPPPEDPGAGGPRLRRTLSLPLLVFYGLGTMVGGGFYALAGKVAGDAGVHAPLAFLGAALLALAPALCFGELAARHPVSEGVPFYVQRGFRRTALSVFVGWLVVATGVVSAATLAVAISEFLTEFVDWPRTPGLIAIVLLLAGVAIWGIAETVWLATVITVIEVGTIVALVTWRAPGFADLGERAADILLPAGGGAWTGVLAGSFLAFYSFIGFEDLVNLAEESKRPRRALPRAILWSLGLTVTLYVAAVLLLVLQVPTAELAAAHAPLALLADSAGPWASDAVVVVSMLAGVNGALVQIVMAARVLYGMGREGRAPRWLSVVSEHTRTPWVSTAFVGVIILVLALAFPLTGLARATSGIILAVFTVVCAALWRIQRHESAPEGVRPLPAVVPVAGACACAAVLAWQALRWLGAA